jgi:hypothetical protein
MVLAMVRLDVVPCERWPKTLKGESGNNSINPREIVGKLA